MFNSGQNMRRLFLTLLLCGITVSSVQAFNDPTKPASFRQSARQENLKLESILYSSSRKVAVINSKALSVGDRIDNKKIVQISKDRVRLSDGGVETTLTLQRATIRQEK